MDKLAYICLSCILLKKKNTYRPILPYEFRHLMSFDINAVEKLELGNELLKL